MDAQRRRDPRCDRHHLHARYRRLRQGDRGERDVQAGGIPEPVSVVASSGNDIYSVLNGSPPFIQGDPYAGGLLQASYGYYINGTDGTTIPGLDVTAGVTFQWLRNGVAIPGKTGETYLTYAVADKGKAISARVTVTIPGLLP